MKCISAFLLILLAAIVFPVFAFADVASPGVIIAFGLLPYVLVAAVIVIAVAIMIKYIRSNRAKRAEKDNMDSKEK